MRVPSIYQTLKGDLPDDDSYTLPFHQDYRLTRSHRAYRLWIPLRDVGRTKGSIELASGSHKDRFDYVVEGTDYPYIPEKRIVGAYETESLTLAAGSAVLFNTLIVHRSVPNKSQRIKFVLILHIEDLTALLTPEEMAQRWPHMPI
jgi:ectoine hydroxylase-related dioxygenase (phytanoyl-CoA dioxygenase family)